MVASIAAASRHTQQRRSSPGGPTFFDKLSQRGLSLSIDGRLSISDVESLVVERAKQLDRAVTDDLVGKKQSLGSLGSKKNSHPSARIVHFDHLP